MVLSRGTGWEPASWLESRSPEAKQHPEAIRLSYATGRCRGLLGQSPEVLSETAPVAASLIPGIT